jgi:hypothetical protein
MDAIVHWFLAQILSPLLLPLCLVATLAMIFGLKPESMVGAILGFASAVIVLTLRTLEWIVLAIYQMWRHVRTQKGEDVPPPPRRRRSRRR